MIISFILINDLLFFFKLILATDNFPWESEEDASAETKIKDKLQSANDGDTTTQSESFFIEVNEKDFEDEKVPPFPPSIIPRADLEESDNKNIKEDNMDNDKENVEMVVNDDYQGPFYDQSEYYA